MTTEEKLARRICNYLSDMMLMAGYQNASEYLDRNYLTDRVTEIIAVEKLVDRNNETLINLVEALENIKEDEKRSAYYPYKAEWSSTYRIADNALTAYAEEIEQTRENKE